MNTNSHPPDRWRRRASRESPLYVISVAAELVGVHAQTLRNYERHGLITPARSRGGNRRYSEADLARIERIAELTDAGLPLTGVRHVLELESRLAELAPPHTALMTRRAAQLPPRPAALARPRRPVRVGAGATRRSKGEPHHVDPRRV